MANYLCFWGNFYGFKWPNISKNLAIWSHCMAAITLNEHVPKLLQFRTLFRTLFPVNSDIKLQMVKFEKYPLISAKATAKL